MWNGLTGSLLASRNPKLQRFFFSSSHFSLFFSLYPLRVLPVTIVARCVGVRLSVFDPPTGTMRHACSLRRSWLPSTLLLTYHRGAATCGHSSRLARHTFVVHQTLCLGRAMCSTSSHTDAVSQLPPDMQVPESRSVTHSSPSTEIKDAKRFASEDTLIGHCHLLTHIAHSREPLSRKRRRAAGVVGKLEDNYTDWLTDPLDCSSSQRAVRRWMLLDSLSQCAPFLARHDRRHGADGLATREDEMAWSGASPFFSPNLHDALCLCLQTTLKDSATGFDRPLDVLQAAVQLELADGESLQSLSRRLTSKSWCQNATGHELAQALKWISLALKRCKIQLPPLDQLLCLIPTAQLSPRDSLEVLSALVRLRDVRTTEVSKIVERNAAKDVPNYSVRDVVYALEAVAILQACDTSFAAATLKRCAHLAPGMTASDVGDVCKYIGLLNGERHHNDVAATCSRELRRVLPALVERTEALLGQFQLRDARCVLRCFQQHKIRHSVVFSQLTPLAS